MNNSSPQEPKRTLEDKVLRYIEQNNGKCWTVIAFICLLGVIWRNSWVV